MTRPVVPPTENRDRPSLEVEATRRWERGDLLGETNLVPRTAIEGVTKVISRSAVDADIPSLDALLGDTTNEVPRTAIEGATKVVSRSAVERHGDANVSTPFGKANVPRSALEGVTKVVSASSVDRAGDSNVMSLDALLGDKNEVPRAALHGDTNVSRNPLDVPRPAHEGVTNVVPRGAVDRLHDIEAPHGDTNEVPRTAADALRGNSNFVLQNALDSLHGDANVVSGPGDGNVASRSAIEPRRAIPHVPRPIPSVPRADADSTNVVPRSAIAARHAELGGDTNVVPRSAIAKRDDDATARTPRPTLKNAPRGSRWETNDEAGDTAVTPRSAVAASIAAELPNALDFDRAPPARPAPLPGVDDRESRRTDAPRAHRAAGSTPPPLGSNAPRDRAAIPSVLRRADDAPARVARASIAPQVPNRVETRRTDDVPARAVARTSITPPGSRDRTSIAPPVPRVVARADEPRMPRAPAGSLAPPIANVRISDDSDLESLLRATNAPAPTPALPETPSGRVSISFDATDREVRGEPFARSLTSDPAGAMRAAIAAIKNAPGEPEARAGMRRIAETAELREPLALLLSDEARAAQDDEVGAALFEELADLYEGLDQPLDAIGALEELVALGGSPEHHDRLAWMYRKAGAWAKAAAQFELVGQELSDGRGHAALRAAAQLHREHGMLDRAADIYRAIVERKPADAQAWRELDDVLSALGRWREVADMRGQRAKNAGGVERAALLRSQARALEQAGEMAAAARVVGESTAHAPDDLSGLVDHADVLARAGRAEEAAALLRARIRDAVERGADADHVAALRLRVVGIVDDAGDRIGAAGTLVELLEAAPEYVPALERAAAFAATDPDPLVHAKALLCYAAALPRADASLFVAAARRFRDAGDHEAAVRTLEDVDGVDHELEDARIALIVDRARAARGNDVATAERKLRTILSSRFSLDAHLALVDLLMTARRFDDAAEHLHATLAETKPRTRMATAGRLEELRASISVAEHDEAIRQRADYDDADDVTGRNGRLDSLLPDARGADLRATLAVVDHDGARRARRAASKTGENPVVERMPASARAALVHRLALVEQALDHDDEAHRLLHEAHRLDRRALPIVLALGESCFRRRLWREAARLLGALAEHPDVRRHAAGVATGLVHAAAAEVRSLRPANALAHLEAAAQIDAGCAAAWHGLAQAAIDRGELERGADYLEREAAATTEPRERVRLYDALGDMARDVFGDMARAERCWAEVLDLAEANVLNKLLAVQRKRGATRERARTCLRLAELRADDRKAILEEAAPLLVASDPSRALELATELANAHPFDLDALTCASDVAVAAGDHRHAAVWLRRALAPTSRSLAADAIPDEHEDAVTGAHARGRQLAPSELATNDSRATNRAPNGRAPNGSRALVTSAGDEPRIAALWRKLGDAERVLDDHAAARRAYRNATTVAPLSDGALAARRALVELTADRPATAPFELQSSLFALVEAESDAGDTLSLARELVANEPDHARALFELARALGATLSPDDERCFAAHAPRAMARDEAYAAALDAAARRDLIDDENDPPIAGILALLADVASRIVPDPRTALVDANLLDAQRLSPTGDSAAAAILPQIAKMLGGPPTLLYTSARKPDDITLLAATTPVIVIGLRLAQADDATLRFHLGRMVELSRWPRVLAAGLPRDDFGALLSERVLAKLPITHRKRFADQLASSLDPDAYVAACHRAADRAGLLACGNTLTALSLASSPYLVQLAATRGYLAARRRLRTPRG